MIGLSGEVPKGFGLLDREIQDLEERVKKLEDMMRTLPEAEAKNIQDALKTYENNSTEKIALTIALALASQNQDMKSLMDELNEVTVLARRRNKTVSQVIADLDRKGTLPPKLKVLRDGLEIIVGWLRVLG